MAMLGSGTDEFFDWYFTWLDREANPETGYWSMGLGHLKQECRRIQRG
jgi:hypothetical protein